MTEDDPGDSGILTVNDVDNGQNVFQPQNGTSGSYGTFSIDAAGNWSYTRTADLQSMNAVTSSQTASPSPRPTARPPKWSPSPSTASTTPPPSAVTTPGHDRG